MGDFKNSNNEKTIEAKQAAQLGLLKFYLLASLFFIGFYVAYNQLLIGSEIFKQYLEILAVITAKVVGVLIGEEPYIIRTVTGIKGEIWVSDFAHIVVNEGCDGIIVYAAIVAAIMAWAGKLWQRLVAAVFGVCLLLVINIARIVAALIVDVYFPLHFDTFNNWILPTVFVASALAYFCAWAMLSTKNPVNA